MYKILLIETGEYLLSHPELRHLYTPYELLKYMTYKDGIQIALFKSVKKAHEKLYADDYYTISEHICIHKNEYEAAFEILEVK